jgi:pimeloyl-ACP methyl ester carboxylesterase
MLIMSGALAGPAVLARNYPLLAAQNRPPISLLDPPPPGVDPYATVNVDHDVQVVRFRSQDRQSVSGLLHLPKGKPQPEVVVAQIHPESDVAWDWRYPYYTRDGIAGFSIAHRYINDDQNLIMEEVMLDMAAAMKYLKEERGFKRVVLLGHSGGGSTVCFYQSQAETRPPKRVSSTPTGDPPDLNKFDMPPADGIILSSAHWGRGWTVLHRLDPSVTDENDPLSVDPALDMYNPANGFKIPPQTSKYSPEFQKKFLAGQDDRMERLVARARQLVEAQDMARALMKDPFFSRRSQYEQIKIERVAVTQHSLVIYRKEANLKYTDLSIDPNDRIVGSNQGSRPDLSNYEDAFHPRPIRPRAFLSSESTASNVYTLKMIKAVTVPVLVMCGTADLNEWPEEQQRTFDEAVSKDKEIAWIVGANHPYLPSGPKSGERDQRTKAGSTLNSWIKKRFSAGAGSL